MTYFPDVNVWLALVVAEHAHSRRALDWADRASRDWLVFSRVTQMGLLRLLTNPAVMGRDALIGSAAWGILDDLLARDNVRFAREPDGIEDIWRQFTPSGRAKSNFWTDAYLAAYTRAAGFTLVTFDRGFSKYPDLPLKLLVSA